MVARYHAIVGEPFEDADGNLVYQIYQR